MILISSSATNSYLLANAAGSRLPMGNVKGADGNNLDSAGEIRKGADGGCGGIVFSISSSFTELSQTKEIRISYVVLDKVHL